MADYENLPADTDIGKLSELVYHKGPFTTSGLVEETGQDLVYLKKKLKELRDLGKVYRLEADDFQEPIWHKEPNEIPSVIKDMVESDE